MELQLQDITLQGYYSIIGLCTMPINLIEINLNQLVIFFLLHVCL